MAPPTSLPPELLLKIFKRSLPQRLDHTGRLTFQVIRSVCSTWRSICLTSPILWSSLSVNWELKDIYRPPDDLLVVDKWFLQSGPSVPLQLEYVDSETVSLRPDKKELMNTLIQRYQSRWKYLRLYVASAWFNEALLSSPSHDWVNLQYLSLWVIDLLNLERYPDKIPTALESLSHMTSLRCLSVEDHTNGEDDAALGKGSLGPTNLPELHLTCDEEFSKSHCRFISGYTNLSKLQLTIPSDCKMRLGPQDHVTLPSLLSLSLKTTSTMVLSWFTTEALAEVVIDLEPSHDHDEHHMSELEFQATFSNFFNRCTSVLHSIEFRCPWNLELIRIFLFTLFTRPSVTRLTLDMWPFTPNHDTPTEIQWSWLPALRELIILIDPARNGQGGWDEANDVQFLEGLAAFLLTREGLACEPLERLVIHERVKPDFSYTKIFEDVEIGEIRVMIPW